MKDVNKGYFFSRVELKNWRNFSSTDIPLGQRVFLVGPNAAGKSNFLHVFRFLKDIVTDGGGLQVAVKRLGGVKGLRALMARGNPNIGVSVDVRSSDGATQWRYEIELTQGKSDERVKLVREKVVRDGKVLLNRPDDRPEDKTDPELLTQTEMEQIKANKSFRELAQFFASTRYLHIVPQLVREPDRSVGRKNDPYGGDFLDVVARAGVKERRGRLNAISKALSKAVPQLGGIELALDEGGAPHLKGKYKHWRPQGAWQNEDQFSDGTLRLVGLLWALQEEDVGTLLLEEPELSLHPSLIRLLPQVLARIQRRNKRQVILSTHSMDLLQDPGIGLNEVVLLIPADEGTQVKPADTIQQATLLLSQGMTMADVILPYTAPKNAEQLMMEF